jgi:hypothetical protein
MGMIARWVPSLCVGSLTELPRCRPCVARGLDLNDARPIHGAHTSLHERGVPVVCDSVCDVLHPE